MKKISLSVIVLLLAGCSAFEEKIEAWKGAQGATQTTQKTQQVEEPQEILPDPFFTVEPSTWFGIVTTDMVEYVNIVTGETATGPSHGGYLDNHPDWEQVPMENLLTGNE